MPARRAARINVKALLVLLCVLVLLGVGVVVGHRIRKRVVAERALAAGQAALAEQDWATATKQLRIYLGKFPDDEKILETYAESLLKIRPYTPQAVSAAIGAYRRLLRKFRPGDEKICTELAKLYMAVRDYNECAYICRQRLDKAPEDPVALYYLADSLARQQKPAEAAPVLEELIAAHPDDVRAYTLRADLALAEDTPSAADTAAAWFDKAVQANPDSAEALVQRGKFLREHRKDRKAALADLEAAEALGPTDPNALVTLAEEWFRSGQPDKARTALQATQDISDAELTEAGLAPGVFALRRLLVRGSLALLSESADECSDVADQGLGRLEGNLRTDFLPVATELYLKAGRTSDARGAVQEFQDALDESTSRGLAARDQWLIMDAAVSLAEGKPYAAINALTQFVSANPTHAPAWRLLWQAYEKTNQPRRAYRALDKYLSRQPADAEASLAMAEASLQDDPPRAWRFASVAQRLAPQNPEAKLYRIQAALRGGAGRLSDDQVAELSKSLASLREALPRDARVRMLEAVIELGSGNADDAVAKLAETAPGLEHAFPVLLEVSKYYVRKQERPRAIAVMQEAMKDLPDSAGPRIALSQLYEDAGRLDEAKQTLASAREDLTGEEQVTASYALAMFDLRNGARDEGIDDLRELAQQRPDDAIARLTLLRQPEIAGDATEAQALIEELKAIEGEPGLRWRVEQANRWLNEPDWRSREDQIVSMMQECSRRDPEWTAPTLVLGRLFEMKGRPDSAERLYRQTLDADKRNVGAAAALLALLVRQGRFADARAILDRFPTGAQQLSGARVDVAIGLGDYGTAIEALKERIEADSSDAVSRVLLAQILYQKQEDFGGAMRLLDESAEIAPNLMAVSAARAELLRAEGREDEALAVLDAAVKRRGDYDAYAARAAFQESAGHLDAAEADFRRLTQLPERAANGYAALGRFLQRHGRTEEAVAAWKAGLGDAPDDYTLRVTLARALLGSGDDKQVAQAREMIAALAKDYPDEPDVLAVRAIALLLNPSDEAVAQAESILKRIIEVRPTAVEAHLQLIAISQRRGDREQAYKRTMQALAVNEDNAQLQILRAELEADMGRTVVATTVAESVLAQDPDNRIALAFLARLMLRAGDLEQAERFNDSLLAKAPEDDQARIMRARILSASGRTEDAIHFLEAALEDQDFSSSVGGLVLLAQLYRSHGDLAAAEKTLDHLDRIAPEDRRVRSERLHLLVAQRRFEDVIDVLQSSPVDDRADIQTMMVGITLLMSSTDTRHLDAARRLLERVIERAPDRTDSHFALAVLYFRRHNFEQAVQQYHEVLRLDSFHRDALNDLAWILGVELDRVEEGIELANRAVARYPDDPNILDTRAVLLMQAGRVADARADLTRCLELADEPSTARAAALLHLGELLLKDGDQAAAQARLQEAQDLDRRHHLLSKEMREKLEQLLASAPQ